jgi:hypothetical protein
MIRDALERYVKATKKVWPGGRESTVGASEIGLCARRVHWTKRNGIKNVDHEESWGAQVRGTIMEQQFWHPALKRRFGRKFRLDQQKTLRDGALSATPDGLLVGLDRECLKDLGVRDIGESQCILVESKTIDPRVNLIKEKEENAYQVQVQLGLVRKLTKYKPEYALISYIDASFWNEILEFPVKFDPRVFEEAERRAARILEGPPKALAPEGWIAGGRECEYCPFTDACGVIRRSVPERDAAADPQFQAEVEDACREICELKDQAEAAETQVRVKEQALKDRLREKGVRKIPRVVVWSAVKGRTSYDNKAIREAAAAKGVDVEGYSTVGEPTDRLQIFPLRGRAP